jgi:hypothetical protein
MIHQDYAWVFLREFTGEILQNVSSRSFRDSVHQQIRQKLNSFVKNKDVVLHELGEAQGVTHVLSVVPSITTHPSGVIPLKVDTSQKTSEVPVIDLGKVNDLLSDSEVYVVECSGPGKFLSVKRPKGVTTSSISLSEDEIKRIIANFASASNVYPTEGVFNAQFKNFSLVAVMSELAGSRFVLTRYLDVSKLIA